MPGIAAIILAAGDSKRLRKGGIETPKPLLPVGNETLLSRAVGIAATVAEPLVILGYKNQETSEYCKKIQARYRINFDYKRGQTSSLKTGIRNLPAGINAFLIYPVDCAQVKEETVRLLVEKFQQSGKKIVIPTYRGKGGHPAVVSAELSLEFLDLGDDEPASNVMHEDPKRLLLQPVDDEGVVSDIDSPEDYEKIR